jgi:hypothetical protein
MSLLPKRNLLSKVVGFTGKKFTLVQFALHKYVQNVVHRFVAPKNLNKADSIAYLEQLSV